MVRRARLDAELVRRGLARSRDQAAEFVASGRVHAAGARAHKAATAVAPDTPLLVLPLSTGEPDYVSRGGHKLAGVLDALGSRMAGPRIAGRRCLDAGASTGGFTDVLSRRGAAQVVAVDVGYGQLAWRLRSDPRVRVLDRTNVRHLTPADIHGRVDLVVADLSFISLRLVLPALAECSGQDADVLPMVKPQFEVGRDAVGPGGVVRDPVLHAHAVRGVARVATEIGFGVRAVEPSPLPGPSGNVEFFLWLRRDAGPLTEETLIRAVSEDDR